MKLVRVGAFTALALFAAQQANAQSLHGVRAEANIGIDRFYSEGNHDDHLGWGGEIGADFDTRVARGGGKCVEHPGCDTAR